MGRGLGRGLASIFLSLYSQGLLGGLPGRERYAKVRGLEQLGEISRKPTWTTLTPGQEYDPAAEKILPGQQRMEVGGKYYRPPAGKTREEMVGPSYGELGALGGIVKDLPFSQLITSKAGAGMMRPWLSKLMPPETVEETLKEPMFPSPAIRKLQDYERIMKEKDVLPEQKKGMEDIAADIIFGVMEKMKQPTITMAKPGETPIITRGERIGERLKTIPPGEGKPRPGVLGQYDEWKKANPGKTFADYKKAMKGISLMEAPPSIEELDDQVRKWMVLEKSLAEGSFGSETLQMAMAFLPKDDPFKKAYAETSTSEELVALQQEATKHREYYEELLEEAIIKKEDPSVRKDEYGWYRIVNGKKEYAVIE